MSHKCTNSNRNGNCLDRNAERICDECAATLAPDELRERAGYFKVAKWKRLRQGAAKGCTYRSRKRVWRQNPRRYHDVMKTCMQRLACMPCEGCLAAHTEADLRRYAGKLYDRDEQHRQYWADLEEAKEYTRELRRKGVIGIEWNIEQDEDIPHLWMDSDSLSCAKVKSNPYPERRILINGLFEVSKPCFAHGINDGLLPPPDREELLRIRRAEREATARNGLLPRQEAA